jgi:phosphate transport system substrate-binding protein
MKKLLFVLSAFAVAAPFASAQKLVIKGSDTLGAKLVPALKEAYVAKNPGVNFEIAAEGSTTGIAAIIDGTAQIGMASRRATAVEVSNAQAKGVAMTPTVVAYDGIAIVVNAANPISDLSPKQLEQLFAGDVNDWSAIGGNAGKISIYTRNTASGTYADFRKMGMRNRDYATSSQKMAGNEQIVAEVAKNPSGVGYVGLAYTREPGIKVVTIDGVAPSRETILRKENTYLLSRPTFYYTNGKPSGEAAKFLAFTLSPEGQKIVEDQGFVAIPKK